MRIVVAECSAMYTGRLTAQLRRDKRLIMVKTDGSVLLHNDGGSYKPLNWMSAPCTLRTVELTEEERKSNPDVIERWEVSPKKVDGKLVIDIYEKFVDIVEDLGVETGLVKDGVEAHLQQLLAEQITVLGPGYELVRREFPTAIGPVDILAKDANQKSVAIEIKRRGEIDGVEQLTRYLELLNRDPRLAPVSGVFAAQEIKPQARVLAEDRGIRCVVLDYDELRGLDDGKIKLF